MAEENLVNENIKHTEGAEMPDASESGQLMSRARADLPALRAFLTSKSVLIPAAISGVLGAGYYLFMKQKRSSPMYRIKSAFKH